MCDYKLVHILVVMTDELDEVLALIDANGSGSESDPDHDSGHSESRNERNMTPPADVAGFKSSYINREETSTRRNEDKACDEITVKGRTQLRALY